MINQFLTFRDKPSYFFKVKLLPQRAKSSSITLEAVSISDKMCYHIYIPRRTLNVRDQSMLIQQSKSHGCWCPGSLHRQDTSTQDIDYVKWVSSCLTGGISTTWIMSMWSNDITWWHHQMETFSMLLAFCAENSPIAGEFPSQRLVTQSFEVFFDLCLNKRLSKQSWGWWF